MPYRKAHENVSVWVLGHKYTRVHQWLDGTFTRRKWRTHRLDRHHQDAINKKFKKGSGQWKAANLHVILDLAISFGMVYLPKDREDLKRIFMERGIL